MSCIERKEVQWKIPTDTRHDRGWDGQSWILDQALVETKDGSDEKTGDLKEISSQSHGEEKEDCPRFRASKDVVSPRKTKNFDTLTDGYWNWKLGKWDREKCSEKKKRQANFWDEKEDECHEHTKNRKWS